MAEPIEKTILDYLNDQGINAYMSEPDHKDPESDLDFAVIQKTGSSEENFIYQATIAIQSYGKSLYRAALLNELVKETMRSAVVLDRITKVKLNSDYDYTKTETKQPRYQAVFDITHY